MINAFDLHFGNLVKDERGTIWEVEYWDPSKTYINLKRLTSAGTLYTCKYFENLFPIQIDLAWLDNDLPSFRNTGSNRSNLAFSNIAVVDVGGGEFGVEVKGFCITYIKFRHQLQNIFKILTNTFLELGHKNELILEVKDSTIFYSFEDLVSFLNWIGTEHLSAESVVKEWFENNFNEDTHGEHKIYKYNHEDFLDLLEYNGWEREKADFDIKNWRESLISKIISVVPGEENELVTECSKLISTEFAKLQFK